MSENKPVKGGFGAGIIPHIEIDGEVHVVLGERKLGIRGAGQLSVPFGLVDELKDCDQAREWRSYPGGSKVHNLADTAIRETREEANLNLQRSRMGRDLWGNLSYSYITEHYFYAAMFPYLLTKDELNIMREADMLEMHKWRPFKEQTIDSLSEAGKIGVVASLEYEVIKLLFEQFHKEERYQKNLKSFFEN